MNYLYLYIPDYKLRSYLFKNCTMRKADFCNRIFIVVLNLWAQVGIGTTAPDASSALDIASTDKGFNSPSFPQRCYGYHAWWSIFQPLVCWFTIPMRRSLEVMVWVLLFQRYHLGTSHYHSRTQVEPRWKYRNYSANSHRNDRHPTFEF